MGEFVQVGGERGDHDDPACTATDERAQRAGSGRDRGRCGGEEPAVRAVVLFGGEGLRGRPTTSRRWRRPPPRWPRTAAAGRLSAAWPPIGKPVVAAVTGSRRWPGTELPVLAGEGARPEILLGITGPAGGTQRLPHLIGLAGPHQRRGGAPENEIGLVDKVVPDAEVYRVARRTWWPQYATGPAVALRARRPSTPVSRSTWTSPGNRAAELRRAIRNRGPARRDDLHREWAWEGHLCRALTQGKNASGARAEEQSRCIR